MKGSRPFRASLWVSHATVEGHEFNHHKNQYFFSSLLSNKGEKVNALDAQFVSVAQKMLYNQVIKIRIDIVVT